MPAKKIQEERLLSRQPLAQQHFQGGGRLAKSLAVEHEKLYFCSVFCFPSTLPTSRLVGKVVCKEGAFGSILLWNCVEERGLTPWALFYRP
jgi:hypothetical protein